MKGVGAMKRKYIKILPALVVIMLIVFVVVNSVQYFNAISLLLNKEVDNYVRELAVQGKGNIIQKIDSDFVILRSLRYGDKEFNKINNSSKITVLTELQEKTPFNVLGYVGINGEGVDSSGHSVKVSDQAVFKKALNGIQNFGEMTEIEVPQYAKTLMLAVPVYEQEKIVGVFYATYDTATLIKSMNFKYYDNLGEAFFIDKNGGFLNSHDEQIINNLLLVPIFNSIDKKNTEKIFVKDENGQNKVFQYEYNKEKKVATHICVKGNYGDTGLKMVIVVPYQEVFYRTLEMKFLTAVLIILFIIGMFITWGYVIYIRKKKVLQLEKLAYTDELCNVQNYNGFIRDGEGLAQNNLAKKYAVLYLDIDDFKMINHLYGFDYGNEVLKNLVLIFKNVFGENVIISRLLVDHFAILIECDKKEDLLIKIEQLLSIVEKYYDNTREVVMAIGVYFMEDNYEKIKIALDKANLARNKVKHYRKSQFAIYTNELGAKNKQENYLAGEIKKAIQNKDFKVFYQPKFSIKNNEVIGCEALIRWQHSEKGNISPMEFIPLAEKNNMIVEIDRFVFDKVCSDIANWQKLGLRKIKVSVNVSRAELYQKDFIAFIKRIVKKHQIPSETLEIEITETMAVLDFVNIKKILQEIRSLGIGISIDDFGTGYSSLSALHKFPINVLKLDRSFLLSAEKDNNGIALLKLVILLAKKLGLDIVCEGVETKEQLTLLANLHCDYGQGYIFSRPVSEEIFRANFLK